MPYQIRFLETEQIVETVYHGILDLNELIEAATASLNEAEKHQATRFLGDCTALNSGGSLFDVYDLVRFYDTLSVPYAHFLKEAILLPQIPQAAENLSFYELVTRNRGLDVRIFSERQAALDWLLA